MGDGKGGRPRRSAGAGLSPAALPILVCPVRGCGAPLRRSENAYLCPRGHGFDRARSGYLNLLQPQEHRSRRPGDSLLAARARRRLFDAGHLEPLAAALADLIAGFRLPAGAAALDVGCGEGSLLGRLAREHGLAAHGVDLSAPAIDLAARRFPGAFWVVANADRRLPWADASFNLLLVLLARLHAAELHRLLAAGGRLVVAVPAADDLWELREALYGKAERRDRLAPALAALAAQGFGLTDRRAVRWSVRLDRSGLDDLLLSSYRGARRRERQRVAELRPAQVTMSVEIAALGIESPG